MLESLLPASSLLLRGWRPPGTEFPARRPAARGAPALVWPRGRSPRRVSPGRPQRASEGRAPRLVTAAPAAE